MSPTDAEGLASSVDPDQTAPLEQSDLGLHCLPIPVSVKTYRNIEDIERFPINLEWIL